eukprot:TRINITY_DN3134_c0_g1_i1.p1 TRINITY_DN3134_c0_g1~~TRINITY_DN3134_c0_g1_i1.p1  ORF type:complete len:1350 (-),score=327.49 TRINITY_DN3134_c0_g1_i1:118-4167(-)
MEGHNSFNPLVSEISHDDIDDDLDRGADVGEDDEEQVQLEFDDPPILRAASQDAVEELKTFPKEEINYQNSDGISPIFTTSCNGFFKSTKYLLSQGANPNLPNTDLITPLHVAAFNGHHQVVKLLLDHGAEPCSYDAEGKTPLHAATSTGRVEVIKYLTSITKNEELINMVDSEGKTALHYAVTKGEMQLVSALYFPGIEINAREKYGRTPLHLAAEFGYVDITTFLLLKGSNIEVPDDEGRSAIHLACLNGHDNIVVVFATRTPESLSLRDRYGLTPLALSCLYGKLECVKVLLDAGAKVQDADSFLRNCLHAAAFSGSKEIFQALLNETSNGNQTPKSEELLNSKDKFGRTPLFYATRTNRKSLVRFLLEKMTVDVSIADETEMTALHLASLLGFSDIVQLLWHHGAPLNPKEINGRSPLHMCAATGFNDCITFLILKGADIDLRDTRGLTPLHLASKYGHYSSVELLSSLHADINGRTAYIGYTPLHLAAQYGHKEVLRSLLGNGVDVNTEDNKGRTALHLAAFRGHVEACEVLLSNSESMPNKTDYYGNSAIHLAAKQGKSELIELLISKAAYVNIKNFEGRTPLHFAAQHGHAGCVSVLIQKGASINDTDRRSFTALMLSALHGHDLLVDFLLRNGADLSAVDGSKRTALHLAAYGGHTRCLELLISKLETKGIHVDIQDSFKRTPLFYVLMKESNSCEAANLLLSKGADTKHRDKDLSTPLHIAAHGGHCEFLELLVNSGGDISSKDKGGATPLHMAVASGKMLCVWTMIDKFKVPLDPQDNKGRTPLHWVAYYGHSETLSVLLENGADILSTDHMKRSVLDTAAYAGKLDCVSVLLQHPLGQNLLKQGDINNRMPMHAAACTGQTVICDYLLRRDASLVNARDKFQRTPLHKACAYGFEDCCKTLLENGAEVDALDINSRTPVMYAAHNGHYFIVQLLIESHANVNLQDKSKRTALAWAAAAGKMDALWVLTEEGGARINIVDDKGMSPLEIAEKVDRESYNFLLDVSKRSPPPPLPSDAPDQTPSTPASGSEDRQQQIQQQPSQAISNHQPPSSVHEDKLIAPAVSPLPEAEAPLVCSPALLVTEEPEKLDFVGEEKIASENEKPADSKPSEPSTNTSPTSIDASNAVEQPTPSPTPTLASIPEASNPLPSSAETQQAAPVSQVLNAAASPVEHKTPSEPIQSIPSPKSKDTTDITSASTTASQPPAATQTATVSDPSPIKSSPPSHASSSLSSANVIEEKVEKAMSTTSSTTAEPPLLVPPPSQSPSRSIPVSVPPLLTSSFHKPFSVSKSGDGSSSIHVTPPPKQEESVDSHMGVYLMGGLLFAVVASSVILYLRRAPK